MTSKTVTASGVPTARQIAAVFIAAFTTPIVGLTTITKKNRVAIVGVNWNDLSVKGEVNREMAAAALVRSCRGLLHRAQPLHRVKTTDTEIS